MEKVALYPVFSKTEPWYLCHFTRCLYMAFATFYMLIFNVTFHQAVPCEIFSQSAILDLRLWLEYLLLCTVFVIG